MTDKQFLDALQAEVKRLSDLLREANRQIQALQAENERLTNQFGGMGAECQQQRALREKRRDSGWQRFEDNPVPKSKWRNQQ